MKNKRTLKRRQLVFYFKVFINNTDILAGKLVDITHEGLMLVNEQPLDIGEIFPLRILLNEKKQSAEYLDLLAECRWVRPDSSSGHHLMGFQFVELSENQKLAITRLILEYRLDD
jgi:c-di-GMP-binding flagellar brake protein YcgR